MRTSLACKTHHTPTPRCRCPDNCGSCPDNYPGGTNVASSNQANLQQGPLLVTCEHAPQLVSRCILVNSQAALVADEALTDPLSSCGCTDKDYEAAEYWVVVENQAIAWCNVHMAVEFEDVCHGHGTWDATASACKVYVTPPTHQHDSTSLLTVSSVGPTTRSVIVTGAEPTASVKFPCTVWTPPMCRRTFVYGTMGYSRTLATLSSK